MSVATVQRIWTGDEASESVDFETLEWAGRAPERFEVIFDGTEDPRYRKFMAIGAWDPLYGNQALAIAAGRGIPLLWSWHPYYDYAGDATTPIFVSDRKATVRPGKPTIWDVEVWYQSMSNPLDMIPVMSADFGTETVDIDQDHKGNPILNSAKEAFDPPPTSQLHDLILRFDRVNCATFDEQQAALYLDAVNNDTWRGFPAGKVRCSRYAAVRRRFGPTFYWDHSLEFRIRTHESDPLNIGWLRRFLDQGYRNIDGKTFVDTVIKAGTEDETITTVRTSPTLLDGNGHELASGEDPKFLTFEDFDRLPFNPGDNGPLDRVAGVT